MSELVIRGVLIRRGNRHLTDEGKLIVTYVQRALLKRVTYPTLSEVESLLHVGHRQAAKALKRMWSAGPLTRSVNEEGIVEAHPGKDFELWAQELADHGLVKSVAWLPEGSVLAEWNEHAGQIASELAYYDGMTETQSAVFRQLARSSNADQYAVLSLVDLAKLTGKPKASVQYSVRKLIEWGWLDKEESEGRVSIYRVSLSEEDQQAVLAERERQAAIDRMAQIQTEMLDKYDELQTLADGIARGIPDHVPEDLEKVISEMVHTKAHLHSIPKRQADSPDAQGDLSP